eukprot:gene21565-41656_t
MMKHMNRLGIIMDGMEDETYHGAEQEEEDYDQMGLVVRLRQRLRRGSGNTKQLALEWHTFKQTESAGVESEQRMQDNSSGDPGTTQCPDVLTRLGQLVHHQQGDRAQDRGRSDHMTALERIQHET